jgi:hypothetical protein
VTTIMGKKTHLESDVRRNLPSSFYITYLRRVKIIAIVTARIYETVHKGRKPQEPFDECCYHYRAHDSDVDDLRNRCCVSRTH